VAKPVSDALSALVADAAATHGADRVDSDDGVSYASGQAIVAVVTGGTADFRLRADVAAAAARTTDAAPSARGPEWVSFSPTTFDRFTRDRIDAWFEFAVRQARAS
jgi:hypothetical protein